VQHNTRRRQQQQQQQQEQQQEQNAQPSLSAATRTLHATAQQPPQLAQPSHWHLQVLNLLALLVQRYAF
jgi:hypothetical protein